MRLSHPLAFLSFSALLFCHTVAAQEAPSKGLPPRANPTDYQAHAQAGAVTIAAEFTGHSVATPEALLNTEEYVVVEAGVFGPADARLTVSHSDFSIRINGKKMPAPADPYAAVFASLKDPEWVPPGEPQGKSKSGGLSTGGKNDGEPPPAPPKVPVELKRVMAQRVRNTALPEGDRPLPVAGLIFFQHGGKVQNIRSIELIYEGPAGKATLTLQP